MSGAQVHGWGVNTWREAVGGLSRDTVYKLIQRGQIDTAKVGGRRIILTPPREFLDRYRSRMDLGDVEAR